MKFKLIVFDWDGTLMDSEARILACMRAAFADHELAAPSRGHIRNIIGLGLREAVHQLLPAGDEQTHTGLVERYRYHYLVEDRTASPLFPGARETLAQLAVEGYLLGVATGKGRRGLDQVLEETGLRPLFQATRCADEAHSKPHPDMLMQLMDELGTMPQETLMVGDTEYDLQMAHNAGARSLAVSYGVHSPERLLQQEPLACVDNVAVIPGWLAESQG